MSLLINTKHRTNDVEIMDDFSINGEILYKTLNTLAGINKWLGGNKVTIDSLKKVLNNSPKNIPITTLFRTWRAGR